MAKHQSGDSKTRREGAARDRRRHQPSQGLCSPLPQRGLIPDSCKNSRFRFSLRRDEVLIRLPLAPPLCYCRPEKLVSLGSSMSDNILSGTLDWAVRKLRKNRTGRRFLPSAVLARLRRERKLWRDSLRACRRYQLDPHETCQRHVYDKIVMSEDVWRGQTKLPGLSSHSSLR